VKMAAQATSGNRNIIGPEFIISKRVGNAGIEYRSETQAFRTSAFDREVAV